jgi:2,6-dihydroxypseudooxynicotine hydrolase
MISGANSVKEELHHWGQKFIDRGIATLAFDGPGQGERSVRNGGVPLRLETFHKAVSAVFDYLENRNDIDAKRLVCWGQSTGGQLAMRAAAHDSRIKIAVSLGGGYDFRMEIKPTTPADVWEEARELYGLSSFIEAEAYIKQYGSLKGIIEKVRCPLLLVHGARDNIVAMEEIESLQKETKGSIATHLYADGNHSVCNRNIEMSSAMADWVADQLVALEDKHELRR